MIHIHVFWVLKYLPNTVKCWVSYNFSALASSKSLKMMEQENISEILVFLHFSKFTFLSIWLQWYQIYYLECIKFHECTDNEI